MPRRTSQLAILLVPLIGVLEGRAEARLVVGHIVVDAPTKTKTQVLSGRMNLAEGDAVDFEKLASAEQRLIESDLFASARVYIDLPRDQAAQRMYVDDAVEKVDVHVAVTEKTSWFILPIASLGSGDYAGGVAYGDQNLLGHDLQILGAAQIGQARTYVFATMRDPLVHAAPLTWAIEAIVRSERIRFYDDHKIVLELPTFITGGSGQVGYVFSSHLRVLGGFSGRYQHVDAPEGVTTTTPPLYNALSGKIFLLTLAVNYDDTQAPDGLRRGVRLLVKNELSDRYWGSEFDYSKFEVRTELYGKLGWNYPSLIVSAVVDYPTSSRGVPVTEMLRIGGPNLRGYQTNEFHGDTLLGFQAEDQAVVFRGLPLPWVEQRFNIAAAIFVDAAALLERHPGGTSLDPPGAPRPTLSDFHTSIGAGFRVILPGVAIPAIKADIGYGLDVSSFAVTISVGGGG